MGADDAVGGGEGRGSGTGWEEPRSGPALPPDAPILPRPQISSRRSRTRSTIFFVLGVVVVALITVVAARAFLFPTEDQAEVPDDRRPFVSDSDPEPAWSIGDCAAYDPPDQVAGEFLGWHQVSCGELHALELVGSVDLESRGFVRPPNEQEGAVLVAEECGELVDGYLPQGFDPDGGLAPGSIPIDITDWQHDRRTLWCGVADAAGGSLEGPVR